MGFILGVLIIGALLSTIFGKHVGAMFVLGTGTAVAICFGILLILLSPLIWYYFTLPSPGQSASNHGGYEPGYVSQTQSSTTEGTTAYQSTGNTSNTQALQTYQNSSQPSSGGAALPQIGIGFVPTSQEDSTLLNSEFGVPKINGITIGSVTPGSPADAAHLAVGDIITQAQVDGHNVWLGASYDLQDFERGHMRSGPQMITLCVYRLSKARQYTVNVMPQ